VLYACDDQWWIHYFPELARAFHGEKWTVSARARDQFDLHWIYGMDKPGLSTNPTLIHTGKNSGYQAIGLAALFGCTRILLLGFDFQRNGGKTHWHGDHPRGLGNGGMYPTWVAAMNKLSVDLEAAGVTVINCSPKTALQCFSRQPIGDCV
jgi:hypothetical protein